MRVAVAEDVVDLFLHILCFRGGIMRPGILCDTDIAHCPASDKASVHLLLAIAAEHSWPIEHLYIANLSMDMPTIIPQAVYEKYLHFSQLGWITNGLTVHRAPITQSVRYPILREISYRSPLGLSAVTLLQAIRQPGLLVRQPSWGQIIMIVITVDNFIVVASTQSLIDALHSILRRK